MADLYFVFCVDTEGPLYESTSEVVKRINLMFDWQLDESKKTLLLMQAAEHPNIPKSQRKKVQKIVSPEIRDWLGDWKAIDANIDLAESSQFRSQLLDSDGRDLIINWFVCDWYGAFSQNPRRKTIGLGKIFHYYWERFHTSLDRNPIYFHHHSEPFNGATHHPCRNWSNTNSHIVKLSHNLLEYGHYSSCARSPIMAPDINLWLEQYFPFDLSNMAAPFDGQPDIELRRFADWYHAPNDWSLYRPSFNDYQRAGELKRTIGRCLQLGSRYGNLDEPEIKKGFELAREQGSAMISCHVHDHSPLAKCADTFNLIKRVAANYPDVRFVNASAAKAFRKVSGAPVVGRPELNISLKNDTLDIRSEKPLWGAQPWFCFKTASGNILWDNLDILEPGNWRYIFDIFTYPLESIERFAVAANDAAGQTVTSVSRIRRSKITKTRTRTFDTAV